MTQLIMRRFTEYPLHIIGSSRMNNGPFTCQALTAIRNKSQHYYGICRRRNKKHIYHWRVCDIYESLLPSINNNFINIIKAERDISHEGPANINYMPFSHCKIKGNNWWYGIAFSCLILEVAKKLSTKIER